jgi:hypothetical protein
MSNFSNKNFGDRLNNAAEAKRKALEKFRAETGGDATESAERRAAWEAAREAREIRDAERKLAREAAQAAEKLAQEAANAERIAREAALEEARKAARDARYAARKARQ